MIGQTLSHYLITAHLGSGGMGDVFLAEDQVLNREVALKILPRDLADDRERRRRFEREAQAASSLSHPNIVAIHEIGCVGDVYFIAMEYVEGELLRTRLRRGALGPEAACDIAAQVAHALAAAHKVGLVHRDLKPENLIIREDGYVKLLDFGLAKVAAQDAQLLHDSPTVSLVTKAGTIFGTIQYMSPEQARGMPVDGRSDLFSLGVMLYEMCAGRPPFVGETGSDVLAAVLTYEPVLLSRTGCQCPAELERIVAKALRKNPEERYQLAREMHLDLVSLRRSFDRPLESRRPDRSSASFSPPIESPSSAQTPIAWWGRQKRVLALVTLALVGAGALGWSKLADVRGVSGRSRQAALTIVPLTSSGNAIAAAVSPDGKYVAYAVGNETGQSLWLRQITAARNVQLVATDAVQFWSVAFSPDGNFIYYVVATTGSTGGVLRQIPLLGGIATSGRERLESGVVVA